MGGRYEHLACQLKALQPSIISTQLETPHNAYNRVASIYEQLMARGISACATMWCSTAVFPTYEGPHISIRDPTDMASLSKRLIPVEKATRCLWEGVARLVAATQVDDCLLRRPASAAPTGDRTGVDICFLHSACMLSEELRKLWLHKLHTVSPSAMSCLTPPPSAMHDHHACHDESSMMKYF